MHSFESTEGVVVDIGSNLGFYSTLPAILGYDVHSFDIQPLCLDCVHQIAKKNGVEKKVFLHNIGLGSKVILNIRRHENIWWRFETFQLFEAI